MFCTFIFAVLWLKYFAHWAELIRPQRWTNATYPPRRLRMQYFWAISVNSWHNKTWLSSTKLCGLCREVDRNEDRWTGGSVTRSWRLVWACGHVCWSINTRLDRKKERGGRERQQLNTFLFCRYWQLLTLLLCIRDCVDALYKCFFGIGLDWSDINTLKQLMLHEKS